MIKPTKEEATFSWFPNKEIYGAYERVVETIATTKSRRNGRSKGVLVKETFPETANLIVKITSIAKVRTAKTTNLGVSKKSVVKLPKANRVESRMAVTINFKIKFKLSLKNCFIY